MAKKILFINQEISPYTPESEMSVLGRDLPQKAQEAGFEIRTFMPKWGIINERRGQLHEVIRLSGMNLVIDDTDHPLIIKVASIPVSRIQVYFIDNDDYFYKRQMGQDAEGRDYEDNGERAIFFARGVLETVKKLRWVPDIVVCQGWMSAVVPLYIKTAYKDEPSFASTKVVYSLCPPTLCSPLAAKFKSCLAYKSANAKRLKPYPAQFDIDQLHRLAIDFSDGVAEAVSPAADGLLAYARERQLPVLGCPGDDYAPAYTQFYNGLLG